MKTIGIVAHSAEGGALCFLAACHEGEARLGPHMHPPIAFSAVPMGLSMPGWERDDHDLVAKHLGDGVQMVSDAGADFFVCPDNTAHIVLDKIVGELSIPGIHIADVVCAEIASSGWKRVGLLGTKWTMTGSVYGDRLNRRKMTRLIPDDAMQERINNAIFDELCQGKQTPATTELFLSAIQDLKEAGAECVILGCTEIPLIISPDNSPLPTLDSTRLLSKYAVREALSDNRIKTTTGWLPIRG